MAAPVDDLGFQARLRPEALAVADLTSHRRWTYAQLDIEVAKCAGALAARGIAVGDRVAALCKNRAELIMFHLACARLGAIYVPINWRLTKPEIEGLLEDADPKLLLIDTSLDNASFAHGVDIDIFRSEIDAGEPYHAEFIDLDRPSLILFTSGTSGRPKGALLTERNLGEVALNIGMLAAVNEQSRFLNESPLFHIMGLAANVRPPLRRGGAILLSDGFIPSRTIDRIADPELKVTHFYCVPQMASMLRADPAYDPEKFRGMTGIFTGGAPHPAADILAWLKDGVRMVNGAGMSEAGTTFGMPLEFELNERYAGSVGLMPPRIHFRIVDADGEDVPVGEPGELLLKGDNVTPGYWRREKETREAFTEDGWFITGDIAYVNEEGYFWLVDRRKDMFISGGENVYPAEIEAVIARLAGVKESAVIGVADEKWGEVGHLFWAARDGADVAEADIRALLDKELARYKIPKVFSRIDALPRNSTGKVLKTALRESVKK